MCTAILIPYYDWKGVAFRVGLQWMNEFTILCGTLLSEQLASHFSFAAVNADLLRNGGELSFTGDVSA